MVILKGSLHCRLLSSESLIWIFIVMKIFIHHYNDSIIYNRKIDIKKLSINKAIMTIDISCLVSDKARYCRQFSLQSDRYIY